MIAQTHIKYLPTSFRGGNGIQLLKTYYDVIAEQYGGIGYIAVTDGRIAGFICGIWDRQAIKRSLLKKWGKLMIYGIGQALRNPKVAPGFIARVFDPHSLTSARTEGYELRPIVVLPEYRGQGIADKLTLRLLEDAEERGFKEVFLITEAGNFAAIKFYTKIGFVFEDQFNVGRVEMKFFCYHLDKIGCK
jgi:ribosomal protein S18 acetylase RimI-like enzyme